MVVFFLETASSSGVYINSLSCTNVTWYDAAHYVVKIGSTYYTLEAWVGQVTGGSAGTTVTVSWNGTPTGSQICIEYWLGCAAGNPVEAVYYGTGTGTAVSITGVSAHQTSDVEAFCCFNSGAGAITTYPNNGYSTSLMSQSLTNYLSGAWFVNGQRDFLPQTSITETATLGTSGTWLAAIVVLQSANPVLYASWNDSYTASTSTPSVTMSATDFWSGSVFLVILASYGTNGNSNFSGISQTNVTYTFLCWTTAVATGSGYTAIEVWIGFANGTPGTTVTATNSGGSYDVSMAVIHYFGIASAGTLINYYTNSGASGSENLTIPGVTDPGADLEIPILASWGGTSNPTIAGETSQLGTLSSTFIVNAALELTAASYPWVQAFASHTVTFEFSTAQPAWVAMAVVLKPAWIGNQTFTPAFTETYSLAEAFSKAPRLLPAETFTLAEAFAPQRVLPMALSDAFTLAEAFFKTPGKLPVETYTLTDTLSGKTRVWNLAPSEAFAVGEALKKLTSKAWTDTFSILAMFVATPGKLLTEQFTFSDLLSRATARPLRDTLAFGESFAAPHFEFATLSDSISMAEAFAELHAEFAALSEAYSLLDAVVTAHSNFALLADFLTIAEAYAAMHAEAAALAELLVIAEAYAAIHTEILAFTDAAEPVESYSAACSICPLSWTRYPLPRRSSGFMGSSPPSRRSAASPMRWLRCSVIPWRSWTS